MIKIIGFFAVINLLLLIFFSIKEPSLEDTYDLLEKSRKARDNNQFIKQRDFLEQVIDERIKILGSSHLGLAKLYSRMAHSYVNSINLEPKSPDVLEKFEKAEFFVDKAIAIAGNQEDRENWQLGLYVAQKGNIILEKAEYDSQQIPERVIMLLKQSLKILQNGLGSQSPEFQITKTILARALKKKGNCDLSMHLLAETISWFETNLPPDSERLALQYENLASSQACAGQFEESIKSNQRALSIYEGKDSHFIPTMLILYQNSILYFLVDEKPECLRLLNYLSTEISDRNLSNEIFVMITQDLYFLKLILDDKATVEEAKQFRSILRARRLSFQNSTFRPIQLEIIVALEELMEIKLNSY